MGNFPFSSGTSSTGFIGNTGSAQWQLTSRQGLGFPVPYFRPTGANLTLALDVCPNGAAVDTGNGLSWFDVCNSDLVTADSTATARVGAHAAYAEFGSYAFGEANIPLQLTVNNGFAGLEIDTGYGVFLGSQQGALATNATDGFVSLPSMPGAPSGVPTTITGLIPVVLDTTDSKLWAYIGSTWLQVPLGIDGTGGSGVTNAGFGLGLLTVSPAEARTFTDAPAGDPIFALVTATRTVSVTKLGVWLNAGGVTPGGSGINKLALYTESGGVPVATTGDMTTAMEGTGYVEGTISSYQLIAGQNYYIALLNNFTGTAPSVAAANTGPGTQPPLNGHYPSLFLTGQTAFPSLTPASASAYSYIYCMYAR